MAETPIPENVKVHSISETIRKPMCPGTDGIVSYSSALGSGGIGV